MAGEAIISLQCFLWNGDDRCWGECFSVWELARVWINEMTEQRANKKDRRTTRKDKTMKDCCTVGKGVK